MSEDRPTSRALREAFERDYVLPMAQAMFELEPRCQSMLVTVGQYYCDEAADAVHSNELACVERDPVWPRAGQVQLGAIGKASDLEELVRDAEAHPEDDAYIAGLAEVQIGLWQAARRKAFGKPYPSQMLDENAEMIVALASYCREVGDQEQPSWKSHTPYCLVRRPVPGEAATVEVVGAMHRPEWEDRWDVLEQADVVGTPPAGAQPDLAPIEPSRPHPVAAPASRLWLVPVALLVAAVVAWLLVS